MKILHVLSSVFRAGGGTSEVVPRMCEALVSSGHEVRLVTGGGDNPSDAAVHARANGVDIRYCPLCSIPCLGFRKVTRLFGKELESGVQWADIVHIHGHWEDTTWTATRLARKYEKPYVMQPHGFLEPERLKISKWKKRIIGFMIERRNLNHANCVVATAESEKIGIEKYGVETPISIVPIGIDTESIDAARPDRGILAELGLDANKKTLLYLSRITPIKGLDLLAEAWRSLKDFHGKWQLLIAGPDDRGYVKIAKQYFVDDSGNNTAVFSGPIYGEKKNVLLKTANAFVLPTRSENFGIAVQEGLSAGLPVVCTKGAPWGIVESAGAGKWVNVSADDIAEGLRSVMTADDQEVEKMAIAGKRIIQEFFKWQSVTQKLIEVYDDARR